MVVGSKSVAVGIGTPSASRKVTANISAKINPAASKIEFGGSEKSFENISPQPYKPTKEKITPISSKPSVKTLNDGEENNQRNTEAIGKVVVKEEPAVVGGAPVLSDGVKHENTLSVEDVDDKTLAGGTSSLGGGRFALNPAVKPYVGSSSEVYTDVSSLGVSRVVSASANASAKNKKLMGAVVLAAVVILIVVLVVAFKDKKKR